MMSFLRHVTSLLCHVTSWLRHPPPEGHFQPILPRFHMKEITSLLRLATSLLGHAAPKGKSFPNPSHPDFMFWHSHFSLMISILGSANFLTC